MENNIYNIKLEMPYLSMDPFKQKTIGITIDTIGKSTLISDMIFYSYGIAEAQDNKMTDIKVTAVDRFMRGKINCIIFNLKKTVKNPGVYDKCFIYHVATEPGYYGYVLLNTSTGKQVHKYGLEYADDRLCQYLKQSFNILPRKIFYEFYRTRFNEMRNLSKDKRHIMNLSDYNNLINKWKNFINEDKKVTINYQNG